MDDTRRTFLDLALFGLLAEIRNVENCRELLTADDRKQLQLAFLQIMELATDKQEAA